ncbi:MAG: mechanosensitive ion channel domain-containing protein, partial [Actinomycetota bacterium]
MALDDPALIQACGDTPSVACRTTWNWWHNRFVSQAADWFIARPLTAAVVIVIAALANRWIRKGITSVIERVTTSRELAAIVNAQDLRSLPAFDARQRSRAATLTTVASTTTSAIVWSIALMIIFSIFGINLGPLIAGAGIAAVAVGFGAQSLVKDCIAGFFMLLEDQCGVGDDVNLDFCVGTVEDINLRMTRLRGFDGTLWSIPNGTIQRVG